MMFKFCKWLLPSLLLAPLLGQTPPAPTPTPPPKPKQGFVRLWNMLPVETGDINLIHDNGTPDGDVLAGGSSHNYSAGYIPLKPGRYALKIVRVADPKTALKTFDVVMRDGVYVTILAEKKEGALSIEMLDDTYDRTKAVTGKLTIRQFLPGARVTVTPLGHTPSPVLSDGAMHVFDDLPLRAVTLRMKATLPDGKTSDWATSLDFKNCRQATLLLGLDPYGRFRPRTAPNGQADFSEPVP